MTPVPGPHVLYRFYSKTGELLYVGITIDPPTRFADHKEKSRWYRHGVVVKMEAFDSRAELAAAERLAIQTERPSCNVTHNGVDKVGVTDRAALAQEILNNPIDNLPNFVCMSCWKQITNSSPGVLVTTRYTHPGASREKLYFSYLARSGFKNRWATTHIGNECYPFDDLHDQFHVINLGGGRSFGDELARLVADKPYLFTNSQWPTVNEQMRQPQGFPHQTSCRCASCEYKRETAEAQSEAQRKAFDAFWEANEMAYNLKEA